MRTLLAPPAAVVDPSGAPAAGSYRGPLPRVDLAPLGRSLVYRATHRKKWIYAAAAADDVFAAAAVVDLGYASKAFAFACDASGMLADCASLAPPRAARVSDGTGDGAFGRFVFPGARLSIEQRGDAISVDARFRDLEVSWTMDAGGAPAAISAVSAVPGGGVNATEKRVLLPTRGAVKTSGASRSLDGGFGGYDYTHGYLARHTRWRWAFLMGRADDGTRVAMNLVEGFVGENECGLWIGDELFPVGEARVEIGATRDTSVAGKSRAPLDPWHVATTCGSVDLALSPWAVHGDDTNLGVIRARFAQPIGVYEGTVRAGGRTLRVARALGVAEDQDVLW